MERDHGGATIGSAPGRSGRACRTRARSGSMCAAPRSCATTSPAVSALRTRHSPPRRASSLRRTNFAIHTHGSIGPSCAVASFAGGQLTCWTASQATHDLRKQLAAMLAVPETLTSAASMSKARAATAAMGTRMPPRDAALLARAVGKPVRVQWMRADEHGWDPKGPPTLLDMRAGIDRDGNVVAWESELFVPDGTAGFVRAGRRRSCRAQQPWQTQPWRGAQ